MKSIHCTDELVEEWVLDIMGAVLDSSVDIDTNLRLQENIDSIDLLMISVDIEKEFGITIVDDDLYGFRTPRDLVNLVNKLMKRR